MNTVALLNDHGVSMVKSGFHIRGLKILRASFRAIIYTKQHEQEECLRKIETDEDIQEALRWTQGAPHIDHEALPISQLRGASSFMQAKFFCFWENKNHLFHQSNEVQVAAILFNIAVAAHLEGSKPDAALNCYRKVHELTSRLALTPLRSVESQLILVICVNNMADVECQFYGNYYQGAELLKDIERLLASFRSFLTPELQPIVDSLHLNSIIFKNIYTAGAA